MFTAIERSAATSTPVAERLLDLAIEFTFPASDPISIVHAFNAAIGRNTSVYSGDTTMATNTSRARETTARKALSTPNALPPDAVSALSDALNAVLADTLALYMKTKNFHWHVSGPHFRDYHLLFDEQAGEMLAATDLIAERVRKIGGSTLRSIGHISRLQRVQDNDQDFVPPGEMLRELMDDNKSLANVMREAHDVADQHDDVATQSLLEVWMDEAEKRVWFLFEASRPEPH